MWAGRFASRKFPKESKYFRPLECYFANDHRETHRPPGTEEYTPVNLTVTWSDVWVTPTGSWSTAATVGSAAPNSTVRTKLFPRTPFPTSTMVYNATANALVERYAVHCPVSDGDFERGFRWEYLSHKCFNLLHPFCGARTNGPLPTSTAFPAECLPSAAMKRISDEILN